MSVTTGIFGVLDNGTQVNYYKLSSSCGIEITVLDLGGIIQSIKVPGADGCVADVVCGYDTPGEYLRNDGYQGALIGRYANRIKNGTFTVDGKVYRVPKNEKNITALHGGNSGFDKKIWNVEIQNAENPDMSSLVLSYTSVDGEEGFPGNLDVTVTYTLDKNGDFSIAYHALSDKNTPVAMTNHSYFNLAGYQSGSVLDQYLTLDCSKFVAVDARLIPTVIADVEGSPFDFRKETRIGDKLSQSDAQTETVGGGIDHTFIPDNKISGIIRNDRTLSFMARLSDKKSGRSVTVYSDAPGIQIYTGNFLDPGIIFKNNVPASKHGAICLETGFYPDTPNHPDFPSCIFGPGKDYASVTVFRFGTTQK